ncbi:hypothetical protein VF21_08338 [Pseudogymnoascus sp. 05NY08]|nr:hypothetical protein VF21_08338 [Pseudogymnoascus sp. 05NY08]
MSPTRSKKSQIIGHGDVPIVSFFYTPASTSTSSRGNDHDQTHKATASTLFYSIPAATSRAAALRLGVLPTLAESRSVAFLAGFTELYDDDFNSSDTPEWVTVNDISDLWVTPSTDVLHINHDKRYHDGWYIHSDNPLPFLVWLVQRNRHFTRMSIVSHLVLGFYDDDGTEYMNVFDMNFDLLAQAGGPYLTALCVVSLHSGLDSALQKEGGMLFGRLGEERVKLVEAGDRTALEAYYNLWAAGPVNDCESKQFFDLAVSRYDSEWLPRVAKWRERLATKWVNHYWAWAQTKNELPGIQDPERSLWRELGKDAICGQRVHRAWAMC